MDPTQFDDASPTTQLLVRLVEAQQKQANRDLLWRNVRAITLAVALIAGPLIYAVSFNTILSPGSGRASGDYVATVRVEGTIGPRNRANAEDINRSLRRAFNDEDAVGIVLVLDSPGGSAVQSEMIHDQIRGLRFHHPDTPVWAVGVDRLASGAYLVASAAQHICVSAATLTGSIGAIHSSLGVTGLLERVGVEPRLFGSGEHKTRLNMFSPLDGDDRDKMQDLLAHVHAQFVGAVQRAREGRLAAPSEVLFSGDFWVGEEAVEMGLADELCTLTDAIGRLGATQARDFSPREDFWDRVTEQIAIRTADLMSTHSVPRLMYLP